MSLALLAMQIVALPRPRKESEESKAERLRRLHASGSRGTRGYWAEAKRQSRAKMRGK